MSSKVGMIGLGIMGGAMARNLVAAGFAVVGYDVSADAVARARDTGVRIAANVTEVAAAARLIVTSLPSAKAAAATAQEIAASGLPARIVAETSTLALDDKMAFAAILDKAGHVPLDCPLSGTGAQAERRDLVIFASGDPAALTEMEPIFQGFGRLTQKLGPFGQGSKMKFVANLLVAINNVASAEAMVLGMKAGLDPQRIIDCVTTGVANSRVFELRAPMMAANAYPATMKLDIWKKDMAVIGEFAAGLDCPVPLFSTTNAYYDSARAAGYGPEDAAAVCKVLADMAGLTRG
jgi:L-threonate 2-dehydrogenase